MILPQNILKGLTKRKLFVKFDFSRLVLCEFIHNTKNNTKRIFVGICSTKKYWSENIFEFTIFHFGQYYFKHYL